MDDWAGDLRPPCGPTMCRCMRPRTIPRDPDANTSWANGLGPAPAPTGTPFDTCGVTILEIEDALSTGGNLYMAEPEGEGVGIAETGQALTARLPDQPGGPAN